MSAPLRDMKGCLTQAGYRALAGAVAGKAPPELAAHVAGCGRCQDRMLTGQWAPGAPPRRERREPPPPWRVWIVAIAVVLLALVALVVGRQLAGR